MSFYRTTVDGLLLFQSSVCLYVWSVGYLLLIPAISLFYDWQVHFLSCYTFSLCTSPTLSELCSSHCGTEGKLLNPRKFRCITRVHLHSSCTSIALLLPFIILLKIKWLPGGLRSQNIIFCSFFSLHTQSFILHTYHA